MDTPRSRSRVRPLAAWPPPVDPGALKGFPAPSIPYNGLGRDDNQVFSFAEGLLDRRSHPFGSLVKH